MATTVPIPLMTLSANQSITGGPVSIPTGSTQVQIAVDRTAGSSNLNSLPASDSLLIAAEVSLDGGATFTSGFLSATCPGGVYNDKSGHPATASFVSTSLPGDPASTQRQAKGTVTARNGSISFSGTLTLS